MYCKGSLSESLFTISWVMWAYIVCVKKWGKHSLKSSRQRVSWVTRGLSKLRSDSQNTAWQKIVQILAYASHVVFHRLSTREPVANLIVFTILHITLTLNHYIKSHKHTWKMIEQKYNQIWHRIKANKNIVVNHNFTGLTKQLKLSIFIFAY